MARVRDDLRNDIHQTVDVTVGEEMDRQRQLLDWFWRLLQRWALTGLSLSMLLSSLGTSITNVALPGRGALMGVRVGRRGASALSL